MGWKNMPKHLKKNAQRLIFSAFFILICFQVSIAQRDSTSNTLLRIEGIKIEGNRKTRAATILRELEFAVGDSLWALEIPSVLERNRLRLMNVAIFSNADITVDSNAVSQGLQLHIHVTEGWYILPVPLLSLADRNFNVWWDEFNHSFKRVNYGIDWTQLNITGRADALKANAQFGYTNRYEIKYRSPSLNRQRTLGFETSIAYSRAHEIAYNTVQNKLLFLKIPELWLSEQLFISGTLSSRPKYFTTQSMTLEYRDNRIADTIKQLNPDFYLQGALRQRHASAIYSISIDHRDIRPYPLSGWRFVGEARWNGLLPGDDLYVGRFFGSIDQYFPLTKWLSLEAILKGRFSYPRRQLPWSNNQGLGYGGNFVRGYEYYVVDGLDFSVLRSSWHIQLFSRKFTFGKWMPAKAYRVLPLNIYLALNADIGWANDPHYENNNPLANRALFGYGPGIDIVAWYDKTIRMEWSWNDLGQHGFFLRINTGF
jgi:outer membrane protein assembly factor BamA